MKDKKRLAVLVLQLLVVLLLTVNLFGARESVQLDAAFFGGAGEFRDGVWYMDEGCGSDSVLLSQGFLVSAGVYKVQLFYETDTDAKNSCTITANQSAHGQVLTNGTQLFSGLNKTDYEVWVLDAEGELNIQVAYSGQGTLAVKGACLYDTGALQRMQLFSVLCLFGLADAIWLYCERKRKEGKSGSDRLILPALAAIILYSSLPLMTDYLMNGGDLVYHLLRIEGVKDGLLSGQFPVKIAPEWIQGYGYACPVFYGDTLLYIPALLRLIGFTIQDSYKLFILLLNAGTCLVSYYCFRKILKDNWLGVLCSMLYTVSVYRMYEIYHRAALGEVISLMFLPLLVAGFYKIFTEDVKSAGYRFNWVLPTIGFCGIIQSHVLTTYIVGIFTILLCVLLWKRVFRKETFLVLAGTVVITTLLCAWFLVPFFDFFSSGEYVINNVSGREIQDRGLQPAQLFLLFFKSGENVFFYDGGMVDAEPIGLGAALLIPLCAFGCMGIMGLLKKEETRLIKTGKVAVVLSLISMVFSTQLFPWDRLQRINALTATLVSSLEFPSRFLTIATILLVLVAGIVGRCIWNMNRPMVKAGFVSGLLILFLMSNITLVHDICSSRPFYRLYNTGGMGTGYLSGEEYLTAGTDSSRLMYRDAIGGEGVEIEAYEKNYLSVELTCKNASGEESYIDMPLVYYKGYRAKADDGQSLIVCPGENNVVRVVLPEGFAGALSLDYVRPWYWRAAEIVSVLTAIGGMVLYFLYSHRRKENKLCEK